jgi:hypothetical protein
LIAPANRRIVRSRERELERNGSPALEGERKPEVGDTPTPGKRGESQTTTRRRSASTDATTYDYKEVNMKTQLRIATLFVLAVLCLATAAVPAPAQGGVGYLYDNGPALVTDTYGENARISQEYEITNRFALAGNGYTHYADGFMFGAWVEDWDSVGCVHWSIDSNLFGHSFLPTFPNTNYGSGKACPGKDLSAVYLFQRESPKGTGILWDIYQVTVSLPHLKLPSGSPLWLTLKGDSASNYRQYWHVNGANGALGNDGAGGGVTNNAWAWDIQHPYKGPWVFSLPQSESFTIIGIDQ